MNEHEQIKKDHPFSYKGVFYSYDLKEIMESRPVWLSVFFSLSLLITTYFSEKSFYDILVIWVSQIMSIFPNLLGFNLGGYALIVGFGNTDLVEAMTKKNPEKKTTVFQKLSGIFAFAILLQITAFIAAFIVNFIMQFKFDISNQLIANLVNSISVMLLSFLGFWGLFIIPNLVVNVFNFGQMHHFHLTKKRLESERKEA